MTWTRRSCHVWRRIFIFPRAPAAPKLRAEGTTMTTKPLTYTNPVWPHYFADPFVLRVGREYYAYGTGPADEAGREFPILHSPDLVHWQHAGHAIEPTPQARGHNHWAPEVAEKEGRFFLYYSASPRG